MELLLKEDLSTALCLVVVVMSHGGQENTIFDKAGEPYNLVNEIINSKLFKKWGNLPKIVITQACKEAIDTTIPSERIETVVLRIDSAFEGNRAVRYYNGSPFIAELCKQLRTYGHIYGFEKIANKVLETFEETYANLNHDLSNRESGMKDAQQLKDIFYAFNYRVKIVVDPTLRDIRNNMRLLLNEDLSTALCLVVVVMSHGGQRNTLYDKAGQPYNLVNEIINSKLFKKWENLPKIVITQACKDATDTTSRSGKTETLVLRIDSTSEGNKAARFGDGSPFIEELVKHLTTYGHIYDFEKIANKVLETFEETYYSLTSQNPTVHVGGGFPSVCPAERVLTSPDGR